MHTKKNTFHHEALALHFTTAVRQTGVHRKFQKEAFAACRSIKAPLELLLSATTKLSWPY